MLKGHSSMLLHLPVEKAIVKGIVSVKVIVKGFYKNCKKLQYLSRSLARSADR